MIAVDIPSGVNGDTGLEMGIAFSADLTVTFAYRKMRSLLLSGKTVCRKDRYRPIPGSMSKKL